MPTSRNQKIRTAILISGRGSNMVAIAKAAQAPDYPVQIDIVMSNVKDAPGLAKARNMGLSAMAVDQTQYKDRHSFEVALDRVLRNSKVELIVLAGFMRVLSPWFTQRWPQQILNIHPSLLPKYKGLNTHDRVLQSGDAVHGCTVHVVDEELDGGDIIAQMAIDVVPGDTAESLAERLIAEEHKLYPAVVAEVARAIAQTK